ncbi:MAG: hypothetical protein GY820_24475 [Gammaproteobacteria bacterium]|nr:hypothetical protein [Gammaproteobacteria bacterium]
MYWCSRKDTCKIFAFITDAETHFARVKVKSEKVVRRQCAANRNQHFSLFAMHIECTDRLRQV